MVRDSVARRLARESLLLSRRAQAVLAFTPQPSSIVQAQWYINPQTGSDTNDGATPATQLATWAEYLNRTGFTQDFTNLSVDVFLSGAFPASDPITKSARTTSPTSHFAVHGTLVPLLTGNLTGAVATNAAGNTQATVTAPGLGAPHVGKLMVLTASGALALIVKDLGGGTVNIVDARTFALNSRFATVFTPVGNEAFAVYDFTHVGGVSLDLHCDIANGSTVWPPPFIVENLSVGGLMSVTDSSAFFQEALIRQCAFGDMQITSGVQLFRNCYFNAQSLSTLSGFPTTKIQCSALVGVGSAGYNLGQGGTTDLGLSNADANYVAAPVVTSWGVLQTEGLLGLWSPTNSNFGGLRVYGRAAALRMHSSNIYGVSLSPYAVYFQRGGALWKLGPTTNFFAHGSTDSWAVGGSNDAVITQLMPSIMGSAGGSLPALAACTNMTALNAAPFNGEAHDYGSGSWMGVEPA